MSTITKSEAFYLSGWIEQVLERLINDIKDKKNRAFFGGHLPKSGIRPKLVLDGSNEGFDLHTIKMYDYCKDIGKVCGYVIDKEETENVTKVKQKLLHVKELALKLKHEAYEREYNRFSDMCQTLADIIKDMENNLNDDTTQIKKDQGIFDENAIREKLENHIVFEPIKGKYIPYGMYYKPIMDNSLISESCTIDLFQYCLDRADISLIITDGSKSVMRGFMKEISVKYSDPDKYKTIAAESFGVKSKNQLGAIGNAVSKYDTIFSEILQRTDQRSVKKTK